jgi:NitT/TauT family transport system permease protein
MIGPGAEASVGGGHSGTLAAAVRRPSVYGWSDALALILVVALILAVGVGGREMTRPMAVGAARISLDPAVLPGYALRTTLRMLWAMVASLIFTFTYATLAAKSRRAEMLLIPLLDVLQSVPVLGYLSFTVVFFLSLFPGNVLGAELAAIFAIFTSQAWNMAFSFYQSLRMVPTDLDEAARGYRLSAWQRFWRVEVPFAVPALVWNMMMSMSGGWFFVVASEAISVGALHVDLPGVGSYVALAIQRRDLGAVGWAIATMTVVILLYDQLLFRPLVTWADRFKAEQAASEIAPKSWVIDVFRRARLFRPFGELVGAGLAGAARARMAPPTMRLPVRPSRGLDRAIDVAWLAAIAALVGYLVVWLIHFAGRHLTWADVGIVTGEGMLTLARVVILIILATLIWVPIGVWIGLNPRLAGRVQALAQFLAAFPANLLFPIAVFLLVRFHASPVIWLSPLMILGTQWYILFNVVAGASAFPTDLREASASFRITGWRWWHDVMLPGIFPYYVTGAITASGGAWNASIVSEVVSWGPTRLNGHGLGAYIATMTNAGDFPRIALGVAMMSILVVAANRLVWRPLYAFAERRTRLD